MKDALRTRLESFMARLEREDVCMHGWMLSVGGTVKAEAYYAPFRKGDMHRVFSVSKTMIGIGIGILIADGKLRLDDRIAPYFEDWLPHGPDAQLARLTVHDLLRMTTNHSSDAYDMERDEIWAQSYFKSPSTHEPGTVFHYDTSGVQVLTELLHRVSGKDPLDFLNERLFLPAGANDPKTWIRDPSGMCWGGSGLCMSLRDLHCVALLCMQGGNDIIPADYLRQMTALQTPTPLRENPEERYGYGLMCWRTRCGWSMYGLGGQLAVCCPEKNALLCTMADTRLDPFGVQKIYDAFFEEVYPFIGKEDMPFESFARQTLSLPSGVAGRCEAEGPFVFEENPLRLRSIELKPDCVIIENEHGKGTLAFAFGHNREGSFPCFPNEPTIASACWIAPDCLRIRCFLIGLSPCGVDMLLAFRRTERGRCVTVQARRSPPSEEPVIRHFEGVATGFAIS